MTQRRSIVPDESFVSLPGLDGVTLEAYEDQAHGFMTVTVTPAGADVAYTAVAEGSAAVVDSFEIGARAT